LNLMTFDFLNHSEHETRLEASKNLSGWLNEFPSLINSLFSIPYFTYTNFAPDSVEGSFQAFAHHSYLRAPYTMKSICDLLESGYYLEGTILIRNLYDLLVQNVYFVNNKERLEDHVLDKKRIRLKKMFESISPGCYDFLYPQLSEYSHGGLGSFHFRAKYSSPLKGEVIMGCKFDIKFAGYVQNNLQVLMFGFLNQVQTFFPTYVSLIPPEIELLRVKSILWLEESINGHMAINPKSKKFYSYLNPIIGRVVI